MTYKPFALSVKALISDGKGSYLLIKRSAASKHNAGKWDLPGGKVDAGEDFDEALAREALEETSLTITVERVLGAAESETPEKRVAYMIMEGRAEPGEVEVSSEHEDHAWIAREALGDADVCEQFAPFLKDFAAGRTWRG